MGQAAEDSAVAAEAAAFLREQRSLTKLQVEHFQAEHHHAIAGTGASRALEVMKIILQGALTLLVIAATVLFIDMIWSASRDHSLVIERFAVPPDLANRAISGEQLAGLVADKLATINATASSFRAENTFDVDWGKDINIEVPGSGVSLAEIDHLLRQRLGHQTRIGGTLYHEGAALRLSLHTGLGPAMSVDGSENDFDALAQKAAEALSDSTQPYRYSKYLEFSGRTDEALAVAKRTADSEAPADERAWAWAQISNLLSARDIPDCVRAGYRAIQLDPGNALAYLNTSNCESFLGHDGRATALEARSVELASHGGGGLSQVGIETGSTLNSGYQHYLIGDPGKALEIFSRPVNHIYGGLADAMPSFRANALIALHDLSGSLHVADGRHDDYLLSNLYLLDIYSAPDVARAVDLDDWTAALKQTDADIALLATNPEGPEIARYARERFMLPNRARTLVELGRDAEAKEIAAGLPSDCYFCLRTRAWVLGRTGDMASAKRDFAAAIAANPQLPYADLEWGRLFLVRGDIAAAETHLRRSAQLAPHFADPLKYLGDAQFASRRFPDAASSYAKAAEFAPHWGANQLMWGKALWESGKRDDARRKFAAARHMDLSASDRAWLDRIARR
jgi:tetratricopeptide (TPR) repeat protein